MPGITNPPQTPLYHAVYKERYARQGRIREIEEETNRTLLVYVASAYAGIDRDDVLAFQDLLHHCKKCDVDLLIQSPGGDIDRAEKIVYMIRKASKSFRVIVAEAAKSAATLIALASDSIMMSDSSELGPIDPQVTLPTPDGTYSTWSAQSYLDGLESIKQDAAASGDPNPAYYPVLRGIDPALLDYCEKAIQRSKEFAQRWLERGMLKGKKSKAAEVAERLCDAKSWLSHGIVIDAKRAEERGLTIEYRQPDDSLWQAIWRLYCAYEMDLRRAGVRKILESGKASVAYS